MLRRSVAAFVAVLLASCGAQEDLESSKVQVARFHRLLNASDFVGLYRSSSPILQGQSSERDFTQLLEAVHRKLGNVTNARSRGWNVNYHTSGSRATLTYETSFEKGAAQETFVFDLSTKPPRLAGYHIASQQLVIN